MNSDDDDVVDQPQELHFYRTYQPLESLLRVLEVLLTLTEELSKQGKSVFFFFLAQRRQIHS